MDDYIRKDTARRIIDSPRNREQMLAMLEDTPAEDVQTVVRCKDCRLSEHDIGITEYWCCYWDNKTLENGYCSYGERKV